MAEGRAAFVVLGDFGSGFNNPRKELVPGTINAKAVANGIRRGLPYHTEGPIIRVGDTIYVPNDGDENQDYPYGTETWLTENLTPYDEAVGVLYHHYIRFPRDSRCCFARHGRDNEKYSLPGRLVSQGGEGVESALEIRRHPLPARHVEHPRPTAITPPPTCAETTRNTGSTPCSRVTCMPTSDSTWMG